MEYAGTQFEIKQLNDSGHIEGLLASFGTVDRGKDKLLPGCLTKALASRSTPLPMLLYHDQKRPIGAWQEWTDSTDGLYVKGDLTLATRDAQEALALARDRALTGLSIGWKASRAGHDGSGTRIVAEAEIFEGSLVTIPMNDATRITGVKAITGPRDIAEMLQESGISSRRAKAAAGLAWKSINETSDEAGDEADLAAILNASINRLRA